MYELNENNQSLYLASTNQITDLGILFGEKLTFREHINEKNQQSIFHAWYNKEKLQLSYLLLLISLFCIKLWLGHKNTVSQKKTRHLTLAHNFTKYLPIFKILLLLDSVGNL